MRLKRSHAQTFKQRFKRVDRFERFERFKCFQHWTACRKAPRCCLPGNLAGRVTWEVTPGKVTLKATARRLAASRPTFARLEIRKVKPRF